MTDVPASSKRRVSYLPHDGEELQGKTPEDACSPEVAEETADRLIQRMMLDQKREMNRKSLPEIAPSEPESAPAPEAGTVRHSRKVSKQVAEGIFDHDDSEPDAAPPSRLPGILTRVKTYRPSRRTLVLCGLAAIVIWRPLLIPSLVLIFVLVTAIAYLTLGHDRFFEILSARWMRFAERRPAMAEGFRRRADGMALRWDAILDRLPEKWAGRLALPDFSDAGADQMKLDDAPDPFDRLAAERHQG